MSRLPKKTLKLRPPQAPKNEYVLEFIADHSTREKTDPRTGERLWSWAFDPARDGHMHPGDELPQCVSRLLSSEVVCAMRCRTAFIHGDESLVLPAALVKYNRAALPERLPIVTVRDSGHHIMVRCLLKKYRVAVVVEESLGVMPGTAF